MRQNAAQNLWETLEDDPWIFPYILSRWLGCTEVLKKYWETDAKYRRDTDKL
jgi:hypothetical protein